MLYPNLELARKDTVNDLIWDKDYLEIEQSLKHLNESKFGLEHIKDEIIKGCSPCPDVLSKNFGTKESVLFVSTVYGHIHGYLNKTFDRKHDGWPEFTQLFYNEIIQPGIGIYNRLSKIY